MLRELYLIICKIIQLINNFYFPVTPNKRTISSIKHILENTYDKLEKTYYNDMLLGYFKNIRNDD